MIPQHEALNTQECVAGLQVPILYAAIVEAVITFVSRLVALESGYWPMKISALINAITTVALCILGQYTLLCPCLPDTIESFGQLWTLREDSSTRSWPRP